MTYQRALAALSDPTRRALLERVVERPRSVGDLVRALPVSQPAVSQHLKVLKEAGLVAERRDGTRRIYSADATALGELRAYVDAMWRDALEGFAARVDEQTSTGGRITPASPKSTPRGAAKPRRHKGRQHD
jgi:DNA-binding transcriptional ArsR family regulator